MPSRIWLGRSIAISNIIGVDALQCGLGSLRGTDGYELCDELIVAPTIEALEMSGLGMGDVMEVKWR